MCLVRLSKIVFLFVFILVLALSSCTKKREGIPKILVFSKTLEFKHTSIPTGIAALQTLGDENNFEVDTTSNGHMFREEILNNYAAVVFLSTTGNVLNHEEEAAFERYIQSGGGFVGIHAAADTEYDWNWYGRLVGAYFESHPPGVIEADFHIKDRGFSATRHSIKIPGCTQTSSIISKKYTIR